MGTPKKYIKRVLLNAYSSFKNRTPNRAFTADFDINPTLSKSLSKKIFLKINNWNNDR
jgi:hypothetical protein